MSINTLLSAPEVQSAIAPFAISLIATLLLRKSLPATTAIAINIGFLVAVLLINGITLTPLTGTRKIIVLGLCAGLAGFALDTDTLQNKLRKTVIIILGAGSLLWTLSAVLSRKDAGDLILTSLGGLAFVSWMLLSLDQFHKNATRASAAVVAFGFGTGGCAILGASALLGQLSLAIGSAAAAFLLVALFLRPVKSSAAITFGAGLTISLLAYAAAIFARLPWYALIPLALIPLVARIQLGENLPHWLRGGLISLSCLAVAGSAVLVTQFALAGGGSGY